ncbi:MAG: response regulator [Planctomycetaceae bacterium]|nr:response regulator [Planctomycetaceae bacterium]
MIAETILRSLSNAENTDVFCIDDNGVFTFNRGHVLLRFLNRTNPLTGTSFYQAFENINGALAAAKQALRGETTSTIDWNCGQCLELKMFPGQTENGAIEGAVGIATDKTDAAQMFGSQENQWLLETAFESLQDGILVVDENLTVQRVNKTIRNRLPEVVPNKYTCYEMLVGNTEPCHFCPCLKTFKTGERHQYIYYNPKHDRWYELTSHPIFDPITKKPKFVIEFVRDIDEQYRREKDLNHQKNLLNAILDASQDGILALTDGFEKPFANTRYSEFFAGWKNLRFNESLEVVRNFYNETLLDVDALLNLVADVRKNHQPREKILYTRDGRICLVRGRVAKTGLGQTGITEIWTYRDITEQVRSEQSLRIMQKTIDHISIPMCRISETGTFVYVNYSMVQSLGYDTGDQIVGRSVWEISVLYTEDAWHVFWAELQKKKSAKINDQIRRSDGTQYPAELYCDLIEQDGNTYLATCIHDLTEQMLRIEAEKASGEKSKFLAHMSHEIRTPLNGVIGMCDLLLGTELNPKQREYALMAQSSGKHLLSLISDILDFSKIEAGKLDIESYEFDLPELIDSVFGILAPTAFNKGLELCEVIRNTIPQRVLGDASRIRQILVNFIGNAIKFTSAGGIRLMITINSCEWRVSNRQRVRFDVIDSGIGIPKSQLNRLFTSFSQVDSSFARRFGGTGLGLAISKELVHLMDGTIGVESEEGQGSDFWFEIPFPIIETPEQKFRLLFDHPLFSDTSIWVLARNPVLLHAIGQQLQSWNMVVSEFSDLRSAKASLDYGILPRFVLIDQELFDSPEAVANGVLLRKALKSPQQKDQTIIILLVPIGGLPDKSDPLHWLADVTLTKPVLTVVLAETLLAVLDGTGLEELLRRRSVQYEQTPQYKVGLQGESPLVLVAEDNRVNQMVIAEMLNRANYRYKMTDNGVEACHAVTQTVFDLILMDCQMPERDGFEATRVIRKMEFGEIEPKPAHRGRVPIIALTANATKGDEMQCLEAGMDAFCSKPIESEKLFALLKHWTTKIAES